MEVKEILQTHRTLNIPVYGKYPPKPDNYKSLNNWLKEGKIPIDIQKLEIFQMKKGAQGYGYYSDSAVRNMTSEEVAEYQEIMEKRKSEKVVTSKKKNSKKKKEETSKTEKKNSGKKKSHELKPLPDFSQFEGKHIICFDTETTGLSPQKGDELLQISLVDEHLHTILDTYLKPYIKTSWPGAMMVNHISPQMVKNAPFPEEVRELVQRVFDQADYIIGYNVGFDVNFVSECMGITIAPEKIVDVMEIFWTLYPDLDHHKLGNAVETYLTESERVTYENGAHNSLADTIATMQVFLREVEENTKDLEEEEER